MRRQFKFLLIMVGGAFSLLKYAPLGAVRAFVIHETSQSAGLFEAGCCGSKLLVSAARLRACVRGKNWRGEVCRIFAYAHDARDVLA